MPQLNNSAATNAAMKRDIDEAIRKLDNLVKTFDKKTKRKILKPAANAVKNAAKNNIPESDEPHFRYSTAKVFDSIRAPKGSGSISAVYHPGNLKRAIRILLFRRSEAVFVGPKVARSTGGEFKGNRVDAWYAHFVEFGTVNMAGVSYMRRAVDSTAGAAKALIEKGVKDEVKMYAQKNKI